MLQRHEVIQRLLDLFDAPRYLEIGVDHGATFEPLRAARKVGVDPRFNFDKGQVIASGGHVELHETTSDVYFSSVLPNVEEFDVIFLDGLHTFEQTLRDLMSAVLLLQPRGVIVVDDVLPDSYHASLPSTDDLVSVRSFLAIRNPSLLADQAWMGDVYKVPFFIQSYLQQFDYATADDTHGQTLLWRRPRDAALVGRRSLEAISRLEFKDLVTNREDLNPMPTENIVTRIRQAQTIAG